MSLEQNEEMSYDEFESEEIINNEENDFENLWEDINPNESISQIYNIENTESESETIAEVGSSVWLYFNKSPSHAPGYNVCKKCSNKYKLTTSVSSL